MTMDEARNIIALMELYYPDTWRNLSDEAYAAYVRQWREFFADDDPRLVEAAVKACIISTTERYAPNVGQIKERMRRLTTPDEMSEAEAWGLVKNALRNGYYGYKEEYAKLPQVVQRCVGSATQLREWAVMDTGEVDSVIASNFMRSYRAIAKSEAEWAKLPSGFREEMRRLTGQVFGRLELDAGTGR